MAAKVDVNALKLRYCALFKEALLGLAFPVNTEAFPRWFVKNEGFPYVITRISEFHTEEGVDDNGEEMAIYVYSVTARLVVAHTTAEYEGEVSEAIDLFLPEVVEYIDAHELLQSAAYPTEMPYLSRAHFTQGVGFMIFPPSVGGVQQLGSEFQFRNEFSKALVQAYL